MDNKLILPPIGIVESRPSTTLSGGAENEDLLGYITLLASYMAVYLLNDFSLYL